MLTSLECSAAIDRAAVRLRGARRSALGQAQERQRPEVGVKRSKLYRLAPVCGSDKLSQGARDRPTARASGRGEAVDVGRLRLDVIIAAEFLVGGSRSLALCDYRLMDLPYA